MHFLGLGGINMLRSSCANAFRPSGLGWGVQILRPIAVSSIGQNLGASEYQSDFLGGVHKT